MAFQISMGSIKNYDSEAAALRAIECFMLPYGPLGYFYQVHGMHYGSARHPIIRWRVKAFNPSGVFAGYCYDPESEPDGCGEPAEGR